MSGILWPIGLLMGMRTTKARRLSVGQFVKGKNGYVGHPHVGAVDLCHERRVELLVPGSQTYWLETESGYTLLTQSNSSHQQMGTTANERVRHIYKIVDLVNARDQTLITTHHDVMGQESFSVAPWEAIEVVKEGTSSSGGTSPSPGDPSREYSDGDDESVIMAIHHGHDPIREGEGGDGGDGQGMVAALARRRAALDRIDGGLAQRGNFLTGGVDTRRVVSEFSVMAPAYMRRGGGVEGLDGAGSRDRSSHATPKNEAAGEGEGGEVGGEGGRSRSSSTASTESYRGLRSLLQGFKIRSKGGERETKEGSTGDSTGRSSDGKSSGRSSGGKSSDAQTSSETARDLGQGEPFLQWMVVERKKARDDDDFGFDYCF